MVDVKTLCLGLLSQGDKTGYEIKKSFEQGFRHFFVAGFSSIYPALAVLAKEGLVNVQDIEQSGKPDKKVYSLTPQGFAALQNELMAAEPRHKIKSEFLVLMYFGHLLTPDRLVHVLDSMIQQWETLLWKEIEDVERQYEVSDSAAMSPGEKFAVGYGRAVLSAALAYSRRHRDQLQRELSGQSYDDTAQAAE